MSEIALEIYMMKDVCVDVKIEPTLLPVKPNEYNTRTTTDEGARLDISACGLRSTFERSFFDIRVTHPHAASNVSYEDFKTVVCKR